MESELVSFVKGPLPEERQDMPRADDGHEGTREIGGRMLRTWAPVIQQITASLTQPRMESSTRAPPAEGASQEHIK